MWEEEEKGGGRKMGEKDGKKKKTGEGEERGKSTHIALYNVKEMVNH